MFTRDISLEDCVLDLVDNSIDGLIRSRGIEVSSKLLREQKKLSAAEVRGLPKISISYSEAEFKIEDTCGGIDREHAMTEVFNFGHAEGDVPGTLGVYGIGLKRAIFKIGFQFDMASKTPEEGFSVDDLDLEDWVKKDQKLEDWKIPLRFIPGAAAKTDAGTRITVKRLRPEVQMRMKDGTFETKLHTTISQSYSLFLNRHVQIFINGTVVEPYRIPLGGSTEVQPARDEFEVDDVLVNIVASLATPNEEGEWTQEPAGWYVLCNGRVVLAADKTELTGWGTLGSPGYHNSKHRRFVGVVFFQSENALALPWTTTKRGLNRESPVYQRARNRMKGVAKPIFSFLDQMSKNEPREEAVEREIAGQVKPVSIASVVAKPAEAFRVVFTRRAPPTTVRVQYDAEKADVDRIRKKLNRHGWGAGRIGRHTFDYFLKMECPE
jgi:hypothetical protein